MKGIYAILDENNYNFNDLDNIVFKMIKKNIKIFLLHLEVKVVFFLRIKKFMSLLLLMM